MTTHLWRNGALLFVVFAVSAFAGGLQAEIGAIIGAATVAAIVWDEF